MAGSLNEMTLLGNLGSDPELRTTSKGVPFASFSVATTSGERTQWFRVKAWEALAERCAKYLSKGDQVLVKGPMLSRRDENDREHWELKAFNVQFCSTRPKDGDRTAEHIANITRKDDDGTPKRPAHSQDPRRRVQDDAIPF